MLNIIGKIFYGIIMILLLTVGGLIIADLYKDCRKSTIHDKNNKKLKIVK